MFGMTKLLAKASLLLRQPLESFCEVETTHGDALVTKQSDYVTFLRIDGLRRQPTRAEVERIANAPRLDCPAPWKIRATPSSASTSPTPTWPLWRSSASTWRAAAASPASWASTSRTSWPSDPRAGRKMMRWEAAYYVLWTRAAVLTKEERKQMNEEQDALARGCRSSAAASATTSAARSWPPGTRLRRRVDPRAPQQRGVVTPKSGRTTPSSSSARSSTARRPARPGGRPCWATG